MSREQNTAQEGKTRHALPKAIVFVLGLLALFHGVNVLFQPVWYEWNNYHTHHGFYQQPNNTVEAIFLGASLTVNGFIPTQMYEEEGVCAYNLATEWQPMMMSYYWTKEAYRLHPETLTTVLLDVSQLRKANSPSLSLYHKALDNMQFSEVKFQAASDLAQDQDELLTYLIPGFAYHDRWSSLSYSDFIKNQPVNSSFYRGYNMTYHQYLDDTSPDALATPLTSVTDTSEQAELNAESLVYFERFVTFCREHNLRLVLFATPTSGAWSDGEHNAIQSLTDRYGLTFLDFEINPLLEEVGFNASFDTTDSYHMSYSGAAKLSSWTARYLRNECQCKDVRNDPKYSFMNQQVTDWHAKYDPLSAALNETDPAEYLKGLASSGNYSLLISVRDDATKKLTNAQRKAFQDMGLTGLATLGYRDSYVAIVDDGTVVHQEVKKDTGLTSSDDLTSATTAPYLTYEGISFEKDEAYTPIKYSTILKDGRRCTITSGGKRMGNTSSCTIDNGENSVNVRGINVTVYDNDLHCVVNNAYFDTNASPTRELPDLTSPEELIASGSTYASLNGAQKSLYRYSMRTLHNTRARQVTQGQHIPYITEYLKDYAGNARVRVLLCVSDDASQMISTEDSQALAEMGFTQLANLGLRESYCAMMDVDGTIVESSAPSYETATMSQQDFELESAGYDAGNYATIHIASGGYGTNHATDERGLHVLVYDPDSGGIIDQCAFVQIVRTLDEVNQAMATRLVAPGTTALESDTELTTAPADTTYEEYYE